LSGSLVLKGCLLKGGASHLKSKWILLGGTAVAGLEGGLLLKWISSRIIVGIEHPNEKYLLVGLKMYF